MSKDRISDNWTFDRQCAYIATYTANNGINFTSGEVERVKVNPKVTQSHYSWLLAPPWYTHRRTRRGGAGKNLGGGHG